MEGFWSDYGKNFLINKAWACSRGYEENCLINIVDTGAPQCPDNCQGCIQHADFYSGGIPRHENFYLDPEVENMGWADLWGHGTMMAGIVGAYANDQSPNSPGIAGINHGSRILISKVYNHLSNSLDEDEPGGGEYYLASAIDELCNLVTTENKILLYPFATLLEFTDCADFQNWNDEITIYEEAVAAANDCGILIVFPAGRDPEDEVALPGLLAHCARDANFPEGYPNVICVSSYDRNGNVVDMAPGGPLMTFRAPGGDGYCNHPQHDPYDANDIRVAVVHESQGPEDGDCSYNGLWYNTCQSSWTWDWYAGTSAAAANIAGLASLVWSTAPDLTAAEVRVAIEASCFNPLEEANGYHGRNDDWGWGAPNALQAILGAESESDVTLISDLIIDGETWYLDSDDPIPLVFNRRVIIPSGIRLEINAEYFPISCTFTSSCEIVVESGGVFSLHNYSQEPPLFPPEIHLTFEPGARVVVESGGQMTAVSDDADHLIQFLATGATPGDAWAGIYVQSTGNVFTRCNFENASVAIRAISGGRATLNNCDFDNCGLAIASLSGSYVTANNCILTNCRTYGMFAASRGTMATSGGSVSSATRGGIWSASMALSNLYLTNFYNNGSSVDLNQGGLRNSFSTLKLKCIKSEDNNGPGLSCLGGYTNMSPPNAYGRNTIQDNLAPQGQTRTQIYFNSAQFDMCNGRNKICATDGLQIMDATPLEHDVTNNHWCGVHNYPAEYVNRGDDANSQDNRCSLTSLGPCLATEATEWFSEGWLMENDLQFQSAIDNYDYVIRYFPASKEAKLCPERILFCEGMLTKDWDTWRAYFLDVADTTHDTALKYEALASAAWCWVEKGEVDSAEVEFQCLMDQSSSDYQYQKAALASLMAELAEAAWDTIGILGHGGRRSGRAIDNEIQVADPLLNLVDRMEAVLTGSKGSRPNMLVPDQYALHQNYPNPFNPTTEIRFDLPQASQIWLNVYNTLGQRVATLASGVREAGSHVVMWDGKNANGEDVAAGLYIYELRTGSFSDSKKMLLLK